MNRLLRLVPKPVGLVALAVTAAMAVAACGSSSTTSSSSSPTTGSTSSTSASSSTASSTGTAGSSTTAAPSDNPASVEKVNGNKKVVLVTCEPNVFCHAYNIHLTKLLTAAGVSVTQLSDNFDPTLQNQHMDQAIAQKPSAIIVFASSATAIVPAIARAHAAGIPVINVDAPVAAAGEKNVTFQVVADNPVLGQSAAQNLVEGLKKAGYSKANIMLVTGTAGTQIVDQRVNAFNAYMKKYPQYKVVSVQDGNWDQVKSSQLALQVLTQYQSKGGIQGAYGMADYQAAGIIQAAQQLGIPTGVAHGDLVVTGSNCTPTGYAQMQAGKLWGDATQSPIHESTTAAEHIAAFLNGKKQPHTIIDQEQRFTLDNYKQFASLCSQWPTS